MSCLRQIRIGGCETRVERRDSSCIADHAQGQRGLSTHITFSFFVLQRDDERRQSSRIADLPKRPGSRSQDERISL